MKRKRALKVLTQAEPEINYHSALWDIRLPAVASPLREQQSLRIRTEAEHAFFLVCCELYRVIELNFRELPRLIETYSRYRTRDHFRESFAFRYFDSDLTRLSAFDPDLAATQMMMFNLLHELRTAISFTDALPHTIKAEIERVLIPLTHEWNQFRDAVQERYGWDFKPIE